MIKTFEYQYAFVVYICEHTMTHITNSSKKEKKKNLIFSSVLYNEHPIDKL